MGVFSRVKEGVRYILTSELPHSSTTSVDSVDRPRQNRRKTSNSTGIPKWQKDELERLEEIRGQGGNKIWEDDRSEDRGRRRSTEDTLRGRHRGHSSGAREKEFHKKSNRPRKRRRKSWHPKKPVKENNVEEQRLLEPKTQAFPSADNDFWKSIKEIGGAPDSVPNLREYTKEQRAVWVEDDKKHREKERVRQEERRSARKESETTEAKGKTKTKKNHVREALQAKGGEESNERRARYHEWKREKRKAEERRGLEKENREVYSRDVRSLEHLDHEQKSTDKFERVKLEPEAKKRGDRHEQRWPEGKREVEKTEKKRQEEEEKEKQQALNPQTDRKEQEKRRLDVQAQKEKYLKDIEARKRPEKESSEKLARQKAEAEKARKEVEEKEYQAAVANEQENAKLENEAHQKREAQETLAKQRKKLQQEQEEKARQQHLQVPTNKLKPMSIDLGNMDRTYIEGFHQYQNQNQNQNQNQPTTTKVTPPQIPSPLSEKNLKAHTIVDGSYGNDLGNMDRTYIEGFYGCGDCIGSRKYQNCVNKEWLKTRERGIAKNSVARTNGKILPGDLGGVGVDEGEGKGNVMKLGWMDRTFIEGFGGV